MNEILEELINHRFYRLLIKAIEEHPYKEEMGFHHSSLIVKGGSVLSVGINTPNQNGFIRAYSLHDSWQKHSEFSCVNQVRRKIDLKGCTIYNCRITRSGIVAISKPCSTCSNMLFNYGIRKCVYTTERGLEIIKMSDLFSETQNVA